MESQTLPLVAIVGQTASGKSELALRLAEYFHGEIICADSMTVYKGFNVGAAKPSQQELLKIPHHLLDVADPGNSFNTKIFQSLTNSTIQDINSRDKLPFLVGGSGLYIDSVLFGYKFLSPPSVEFRRKLNQMNLSELLQEAASRRLSTDSIDIHNKRRVVRLIESNGIQSTKGSIRPNTVVIGLQLPQEELLRRIKRRVDAMIANGLEDEVKKLSHKYGWQIDQMNAVGYREWREYFEGQFPHTELVHEIIQDTISLAKKQNTWFKRNKSIHWFSNRYKFGEIVELVTTVLNK
jgi:tRNA dimethylallyltransferase